MPSIPVCPQGPIAAAKRRIQEAHSRGALASTDGTGYSCSEMPRLLSKDHTDLRADSPNAASVSRASTASRRARRRRLGAGRTAAPAPAATTPPTSMNAPPRLVVRVRSAPRPSTAPARSRRRCPPAAHTNRRGCGCGISPPGSPSPSASRRGHAAPAASPDRSPATAAARRGTCPRSRPPTRIAPSAHS